MDNAAHKLLESTTQRTLHAYGFSRASSQASGVATDLLSRYLTLLASTCAKYAQHSGRVGITPQDALCALGELGVTQDELSDFHASEGNELRRFAVRTTRRAEDLSEFKGQWRSALNIILVQLGLSSPIGAWITTRS
jgi:histone H3/H4